MTVAATQKRKLKSQKKNNDVGLLIVATRESRAIAGLSMGGYGAFMLALHHPHLFGAAASMSGAIGEINYPFIFNHFPGSHDWGYWKNHLNDTLLFFNEYFEKNNKNGYL